MRYRRLPRPRLGPCAPAGKYYAITPDRKADDDHAVLPAVPGTQYWVRTNEKVPGEAGWVVLWVVTEEPKP
jgi:hypothetical protein